jgi:hypothetical protein
MVWAFVAVITRTIHAWMYGPRMHDALNANADIFRKSGLPLDIFSHFMFDVFIVIFVFWYSPQIDANLGLQVPTLPSRAKPTEPRRLRKYKLEKEAHHRGWRVRRRAQAIAIVAILLSLGLTIFACIYNFTTAPSLQRLHAAQVLRGCLGVSKILLAWLLSIWGTNAQLNVERVSPVVGYCGGYPA